MILFNRNDSLMSDLLTPTGGSNLTFKVSFDLFIFNFKRLFNMCDPGMEHKTSLKSLGYICSNSQQYIVWVKIIHFSFMPKIISILNSIDHVPLIYFVNFLL